MPESFRCIVLTPNEQTLDEKVVYASIPAWDGLLGIAHLRSPLVVKLGDGTLRLDMATGTSNSYFISGGFAQVRDDELFVLTDEATPVDQIDVEQARAVLAEAEHRQTTTDDQAQDRYRDQDRARKRLAAARSI